ncbi:MAG: beta galactosidase jelly roll domain-containing protein, partial [Armatimonadetes bacterium]|nr:beta galactosidase jelly roll domain-containing protein [Armatimonadota bacterium]
GNAWYRTSFTVPAEARDKTPLLLYFAGVRLNAWVYVNGKLAGSQTRGVLERGQPFTIPIDGLVRPNGVNTVVVRVDSEDYFGGIYQPVWLTTKKGVSG